MLGLINLVGLLPVVPITMISGVISDRYSRRNIILITECVMMSQAFVFAILTWSGLINVWHIIILSFIHGAAASFEQPVRLAIIAELVGPDDLTNAVALNSAVYNSARIIGPAIAGVIVGLWGEAGCFLINGISFIGVILAVLRMNFPQKREGKDSLQLGRSMLQGAQYIWEERNIRTLMGIVAYSSFLTLPYIALLPAFAQDILEVGPEGLGILMTGIGVGALLGALSIAGVRSGRRGFWLAVANIAGPALLILFTFSRSITLSIPLIVLVGGSNAIRQSIANSLIQLLSLNEFHGRVMSIFNLIFNGMSRFGALLLGGLAEFIGISWALGLGGLLSLTLSMVVVWRMSYVYKIP
jgi:predicted MFS family arabinose efflux permease